MSANPCGCDPEAGHECVTHCIQHLEELVQVLQDDLAGTRKAPAPCVWREVKTGHIVGCVGGVTQSWRPDWNGCPYCLKPLTVER